jgi:hypothetical protein
MMKFDADILQFGPGSADYCSIVLGQLLFLSADPAGGEAQLLPQNQADIPRVPDTGSETVRQG